MSGFMKPGFLLPGLERVLYVPNREFQVFYGGFHVVSSSGPVVSYGFPMVSH